MTDINDALKDLYRKQKATEERLKYLETIEVPYLPLTACRIYNSQNTLIPTGVETTIFFDSERYDYGNMHSVLANRERITMPVAGVYNVACSVLFAASGVGVRYLAARINGGAPAFIRALDSRQPPAVVLGCICMVNFDWYFNAGDWVQFGAWQNTGGNLNVLTFTEYTPEASAHRVG